jgi:hypothetical protein
MALPFAAPRVTSFAKKLFVSALRSPASAESARKRTWRISFGSSKIAMRPTAALSSSAPVSAECSTPPRKRSRNAFASCVLSSSARALVAHANTNPMSSDRLGTYAG